MAHELEFFIDGKWVSPISVERIQIVNPSTEEIIAEIAGGDERDVELAVAAAKRAFQTFRLTPMDERIALVRRIRDILERRQADLAKAISCEMGSPISFAHDVQAFSPIFLTDILLQVMERHEPIEHIGRAIVRKEPIGVCGLITPWNFPAQQMVMKAGNCLAAGCTMVVKPSEITPLSAIVVAEVFEEAGVPPGVFNLVQGRGISAGNALSVHPDIAMISFTGSTGTGIAISKAAADTVKRVVTELGGKSANLVLDDAPLDQAVLGGIQSCFANAGQICIAPGRLLVPLAARDEVIAHAKSAAEAIKVGLSDDPTTEMGPVANAIQFHKIQALIEKGITEKATLVTGGIGRPIGFNRGFFVQPTVFADVTMDMTIAREEIFGPVICIMTYQDEEEMLRIANETQYGLAGYVQSSNPGRALKIARQIDAGSIQINYEPFESAAPFGGYKHSGNGREWGRYGFEEFLETKSIVGGPALHT